MPNEFYTQALLNRVISHALFATRSSQQGKASVVLGEGATAQKLSLKEGGYCARFIRQVYETACGFGVGKWKYGSASALEMCEKLAADGHEITDGSLVPGDILGTNRNAGKYGHVAIYMGKVDGVEMIAENTSSSTRGNPRSPGTKLTPYSDVVSRVTGVYRLLYGVPKSHWPGYRAFVYSGTQCREIVLVPNGDHRADQGKTYWRFKD